MRSTVTNDRRGFRAWVRANHPDVGGDPEQFAAGLRRWCADVSRGGGTIEVIVFRSRGGLWPLVRWWRRRRCRERRVL